MCGCVLTDQTYNWWKNGIHVFLSVYVHRILGVGVCEVFLSCNLKLLTSHYLSPASASGLRAVGKPRWFLHSSLVSSGEHWSLFQKQCALPSPRSAITFVLIVNLKPFPWLHCKWQQSFQLFFFLFLVLAEYPYNKDSKLCICMLHEKEQCRDKFPAETRRGTNVWFLRS